MKGAAKTTKRAISTMFEPKEGELCIQFYTRVKLMQAYKQLENIEVIHIANEQMTSRAYTMKLLRMGMMPGVADYLVSMMNGKHAYIEFKRNSKSKQSESQKRFQERMDRLGIEYHLVWDVDVAIELLERLNLSS